MSIAVLLFGALGALIVLSYAPEILTQGVKVIETEHFRLLYREQSAQSAQQLAGDIDQLSAQVGALVGHPEPIQLDIEFLGAAPNHAGVFTGGKIRVLGEADRGVVAHELAHAHAFAVAGAAAWHQSEHTRFFDEGLANWVAARLEGTEEIPELAAAIHRNDPVSFAMLVEDKVYKRERDLAEVYPIGQAFVAALDPEGGAAVRQCILQGIGAVEKRRITGLSLWAHLAAQCGFDLDRVVRRMERMLVERAATLPPLSKVKATVRAGHLRLDVDGLIDGDGLVCRFRPRGDASVNNYVHTFNRSGRCRIPRESLMGASFDYQVGVELGDEVVYDRWVTVAR